MASMYSSTRTNCKGSGQFKMQNSLCNNYYKTLIVFQEALMHNQYPLFNIMLDSYALTRDFIDYIF